MKRIFALSALFAFMVIASTPLAEELKVQVKTVPPQNVLLLRGLSSMDTIEKDMESMFQRVYGFLNKKEIKPAGPPMSLYLSPPGPKWAVAAAVPVPEGTAGLGAIEAVTLPGANMASATHIGPHNKLKQAWDAMTAWVEKNQHKSAGPPREVYVIAPPQESDPAKYQTEMLWPVM